jgi:hypothetical protein
MVGALPFHCWEDWIVRKYIQKIIGYGKKKLVVNENKEGKSKLPKEKGEPAPY